MPNKKSALKIVPLGGLGEIGLNCMALEFGDEIIVIDCGVMFSDLQVLGVDFMIPDMTYLKERKDKIAGYFITHGHEDHIGALPWAIKNHPAPIYLTEFSRALVEKKLGEHGLSNKVKLNLYKPGNTVKLKQFAITPWTVNHSIVEALALFIDTPLGKIIFTGDFKIDPTPYYDKPMDLTPFKEAGDKGVLLLMSDSTNVERQGHTGSQKEIFEIFDSIFAGHRPGLTLISVFASNVARIGQVFELAGKYKKKIALVGRSMIQNTRLAHEVGYIENYNDVIMDIDDIDDSNRNNCIVLSTGSQGEYRSGLVRLSEDGYRSLTLQEGDLVILSSKLIPGNERAVGRMINNLFKVGADVHYEPVEKVHVSGHASAEELREMLKATRPKFFIPVHGEYRHLVKHKQLAEEVTVKEGNAQIAVNGDVFELTKNSLEKIDHFEENRIFIEGEGGNDISKVTIKDRRKVAQTGVVFSILIRNSVSGATLAGPDIISRGLFEKEKGRDIITKAKKVVEDIIKHQPPGTEDDLHALQEDIRIGLRRYFNKRIGKKPVVLPVVIDV